MADEQDRDKLDIAELAKNAADAVAKLAVEVGRVVMEGIRSAWESARKDDDEGSAQGTTPAGDDPGT